MKPRGDGFGDIVFELAHPWALLLMPLPLLAIRVLPAHRQRVSALRVPFFEDIVSAAGARAEAGAVVLRRRRLQIAIATATWALIIFGLAKPQWVGEPIVRTEVARDIMLAIDLSGSMDFRDFPGADGRNVSRFEAVQRVVDGFIAERESDRVGLIVFGDRAFVQLPFTRDLDTARQLVALMEVPMAGPKTALGDSIGLAIRAFEDSAIDERILILLTDGNDTASRMTPINAAGIAAQRGVTVYTIGIGDTDATGENRVDFELLADIASRTGGAFFAANDELELGAVYERIDRASATEVSTASWRPRTSLVHWPAGAALLLTLLGYGLLLARYPGPEASG